MKGCFVATQRFRELGDERLSGLRLVRVRFIARLAKSFSGLTACLSFVFASLKAVAVFSMMILALRRPVTLAYSQPGDLVGWSGLVRRSPCEWLTAATPLKLIGFSAEDFYELRA